MRSKLRISVALCSYNGQKYIREQLQSILSQSIIPEEIIICDDVSSDNSIPILKEYQRKYPTRIRLFLNEKNLGYTKNFEKAIGLCTGDIIFLSDQDDVWKTNKVERFLQIFSQEETVGLVYSDAEVVDESLQLHEYTIFQSRKTYDLSKPRSVAQIINNVDIKGCLMAFRTKYTRFLLPIDSYWTHDQWIALILHATTKVMSVNESLMIYRRHEINFGKDNFLYPGGVPHVLHIESKSEKDKRIKGYYLDNNKMKAMYSKLNEIQEDFPAVVIDKNKLEKYIQAYQQLLHSLVPARQRRLEVLEASGVARFARALRLLRDKTYFKYFKGNSSFVKDILAGW